MKDDPTASKNDFEQFLSDERRRIIEEGFDNSWYSKVYAADFEKYKNENEVPLDFYLRLGARIGHDPNKHFSEILYRIRNRDVMKKTMSKNEPAYLHWIEYGILEEGRYSDNLQDIEEAREIYLQLDREFLIEHYGSRISSYPDAVDYYFDRVAQDMISPSLEFSEEGYRHINHDIISGIEERTIRSGFHHFLKVRGKEIRPVVSFHGYTKILEQKARETELRESQLALENNLPGITHFAAFDMLKSIEYFCSPVDIEVTEASLPGGLVVLVPNFLPEILFGGYLAFFDFLKKLKEETRISLHLLVVNQGSEDQHASNVLRMRISQPAIFGLFLKISKFDTKNRYVEIPKNFRVVSYCGELHYIADKISAAVDRVPLFFIQEYEPDFHANTDMKTLSVNAFLIRHEAIYNSERLVEYFKNRTEVFSKFGGKYKFSVIENSIKKLPVYKEYYINKHKGKRKRRLIMYGRPEGHAARNHFATTVYALRTAIRDGVFRGVEWEYFSVGSLGHSEDIDLNGINRLKMLPKMPKEHYEDFLLSGDIGISFITTPHPGIVHFQMAAYGLTTITNITEFRSHEWLTNTSKNIVPVEMSLDSIIEGLSTAVKRADNVSERYENAVAVPNLSKDECVRQALVFTKDHVFSGARRL